MRRFLIALLFSPYALLAACQASSPAARDEASDATPARSGASTGDVTGTAPLPAEAVEENSTGAAEAERAQGTREAAVAATALAAAATPQTLGPWRSAVGNSEARVELWACPGEENLRATVAAAGTDGPLVHGFERLLVHSTENVEIVVGSQLQNCGGIGGFGLEGRFWSTHGERFYFTESREGGPDGLPCGCCPELSAWDVSSGAVEKGFVVSPDEEQVARLIREGSTATGLEVSDTDQSDSRMIALPPSSPESGHLYAPEWSPDGSGLVIMEGCGSQPSGAHVLRLSDGYWQYSAAPDPDGPIIEVDWAEDSKSIRLESFDRAWIWDLGTGTVSPASGP